MSEFMPLGLLSVCWLARGILLPLRSRKRNFPSDCHGALISNLEDLRS